MAALNLTADDFVVGIDFGSTHSVFAISRERTLVVPFVIHAPGGTISHPNVISFRGKERVIGSDAISGQVSSPKNTVLYPQAELGLCGNEIDPNPLQSPNSTEIDGTGRPQVIVSYNDAEHLFSYEQLCGAILRRFAQYIEGDDLYWKTYDPLASRRCVIGVPSCFEDRHRAAVLDAAEIAGLKVEELMDDLSAAALCFGFTRKPVQKGQKKQKVLFVDFGHSFLSVAVYQYSFDSVKLLANESASIGGSHFDAVLMNHCTNILETKHKVKVRSDPRTYAKVLKAVVKLKHVLSTIAKAFFELSLADEDVRFEVSVEVLESGTYAKALLKRVASLVSTVMEASSVSPGPSLVVELLGGTSRLPVVQRTLLEVTGAAELSRHLDPTATIATGCALYKSLPVATFRIDDPRLGRGFAHLQEYRLPAAALEAAKAAELKMGKADQDIIEAANTRNSLEEYVYQLRDLIRQDSSTGDETPEKLLQEIEDWLYTEEVGNMKKADLLAAFQGKLKTAAKNPSFADFQARFEGERDAQAARAEEAKIAERAAAAEAEARAELASQNHPSFRLQVAAERLEQANQMFKRGRTLPALHRLDQATVELDSIADPTPEQQQELSNLRKEISLRAMQGYDEQGDAEKTLTYATHVLHVEPSNTTALAFAAKSAHVLGKPTTATACVKKLRAVNPNHPALQELFELVGEPMDED